MTLSWIYQHICYQPSHPFSQLFSRWLWLDGTPWFSFPICSETELLVTSDKGCYVLDTLPIIQPGLFKHWRKLKSNWPQPEKIIHWPNPFSSTTRSNAHWLSNVWPGGVMVRMLDSRLKGMWLDSWSFPRQAVHKCASVTKQYKLVLVKGRWCPMTGKVTVGLALHWPCVTDFSGLSTYELNGLREGDEHPA